jgi:hypothetical protein
MQTDSATDLVVKIARECGRYKGRTEYLVQRIEWALRELQDGSQSPSKRQATASMILSATLAAHAEDPIEVK